MWRAFAVVALSACSVDVVGLVPGDADVDGTAAPLRPSPPSLARRVGPSGRAWTCVSDTGNGAVATFCSGGHLAWWIDEDTLPEPCSDELPFAGSWGADGELNGFYCSSWIWSNDTLALVDCGDVTPYLCRDATAEMPWCMGVCQ